mgnify:CR=1 FL=1
MKIAERNYKPDVEVLERIVEKLNKKFSAAGYLCAIIPMMILPYYSVIGGWVIKYFAGFVSGDMANMATDSYFGDYIGTTVEPLAWFALFIGLTAVVVILGVEKGVEKVSKVMMPVLVVLTLFIAVYTICTMEGAWEGVLYYITPDFSHFSMTGVVAAMGQLFYSMSLAMGIMITYGSYVKKDTDLNKSVNRIEFFDTLVAFLAGMMIIPAVYTFMGREGMSASGPALMFVALPKVFASMAMDYCK